jgi:transcriptional regulator with XRE-family HTH domain
VRGYGDESNPMKFEDRSFLRGLGQRLRETREALGLTQEELGNWCRLHRTFIGSVERGERKISILNLRIMARALRVAASELLVE